MAEYELKEKEFKIRLEARLKNDSLISAREKLGLSQKMVSEIIGINLSTYSEIERMQLYPPKKLQDIICDFYSSQGINLDIKEVFPEQLNEIKLERKYIVRKVISPDTLLSVSTLDDRLLPISDVYSEDLEVEDLKKEIDLAIRTLTKREADVIRLYFGLHPLEKSYTLEEIGEKFNVGGERIRQIKEKAIRRLRHSSRSKKLRIFLGQYFGVEPLEKP